MRNHTRSWRGRCQLHRSLPPWWCAISFTKPSERQQSASAMSFASERLEALARVGHLRDAGPLQVLELRVQARLEQAPRGLAPLLAQELVVASALHVAQELGQARVDADVVPVGDEDFGFQQGQVLGAEPPLR